MRWTKTAVIAVVLTNAACAAQQVPTIEDHYNGATAAAPGHPPNPPVSYRPSEVSFDPVVPVRTGPETIAVLELGHPGDDGTWIAPHYVVVIVRAEGWADQLEPVSPASVPPTSMHSSPGR